MFEEVMRRLAEENDCLYDIKGNVARLIEKDQAGKPSEKVWSKVFILKGNNVTVKYHGRTMMVPLSSLA